MTRQEISTPCFILDEVEFQKNLSNFRHVLAKYFHNSVIGYSFKTNSLPYVVALAKKQGCYAETVSDAEYKLALRLGYTPEKIIFNGPIKGKEQFAEAFRKGSVINIDSQRELEWLEELSAQGIAGMVGIRVNFDLEAALPGQTSMGEAGGRFGFSEENGSLTVAIKRIKAMSGIALTGLHMHVSSKSKKIDVYQELTKKACEIAKREDIKLQYLDIGGGFFGGGDDGKAYEGYVTTIAEVLAEHGMQDVTLIVEPGASVIATAVDYVTEVVDVKETNRNCFVMTNGSRLHIDPFMRKEKYVYSLEKKSTENKANQVICGYTCMENDRFMVLADEKELVPGDMVTYHIVGAYTMCFNSLFIEYLPMVYSKNADDYRVVRDRWGIEEYLQKNNWEVTE